MRIVLVINSLHTGGAERVFSEDANRLAERGHKVAVCLLYGSLANDQFAKLLSPAVRGVELHARSPFDIEALRKFRRFVREFQPDACLSTLNDANIFARMGSVEIRGVRYLRREANELSMKPWWHRVMDLLLDWRTDGVIAVSEEIRRSITWTNPWTKGRVAVLPNAVSLRPEVARRAEDPLTILCIGSLTHKKDHGTLISACGILKRRDLPFSLVLVGDGAERDQLEELAWREGVAGEVTFTGRISHDAVEHWYAKASVFALPSRVEGSPNVLLEAMAAGLPSVASDIPSVREVIGREVGILVAPGDADGFADALSRFSAEPALRATMGSRARRLIAERFDPIRRLENLEALLYGKAH